VRSPSRFRRHGLTLIEVMLAITILGLGMTALISSISRCLGVVRQARNFQTARHLLGRVEAEHPLQLEEKIEAGSEQGNFEGGPDNYRWSRDLEVVGLEEDSLYLVRTRVSWTEAGKNAFEEIDTFVYAPEKEEGGSFTRPR